jgi:hypothetical protein
VWHAPGEGDIEKTMPNIGKWTRPWNLVVLIALIHCDQRKATSTSSTSAPLTQGDSSAAAASSKPAESAPAASAAAPAKDAGSPEWYACKKPEECMVIYEDGCCTPQSCDPLIFKGYTAINTKYRTEFVAHIGCAQAKCNCPPPSPSIPRSDSNFFALCQQGRCVAVDLRRSKYSECQTAKDCALRFGLGCCEGCGDKDLVTYNPKSTLAAEICSTKHPKCPPVDPACLAKRQSWQSAECVVNQCQLSD